MIRLVGSNGKALGKRLHGMRCARRRYTAPSTDEPLAPRRAFDDTDGLLFAEVVQVPDSTSMVGSSSSSGSSHRAALQQVLERQQGLPAWEGRPPAGWPRFDSFDDPRFHFAVMRQTAAATERWLDRGRAFCHLCDEPVATMATHTGYWDHCNMLLFTRLCARYSRAWPSAESVLASKYGRACARQAALRRDESSVFRRDAIKSLVDEMALPASSSTGAPLRGTLTRALHGHWDWAMGGLGERQYREALGRVMVRCLPPLSAQLQTRFQQKCWGRKNLEQLYDAMDIGGLEVRAGAAARREEKNDKGSFMRQLFSEMMLLSYSGLVAAEVSAARKPVTDVQVAALTWVLEAIAVELAFMTSQHYMERAEVVLRRNIGSIAATNEALESLGFTL